MRFLFILLFVAVFLLSGCEKDAIPEEDSPVAFFDDSEPSNIDYNSLEYFKGKIDDVEFEITDPDVMGAEIDYNALKNYYTLAFWAYDENSAINPNNYKTFGGYICYYSGAGFYTTGVSTNANFCYYLFNNFAGFSDADWGTTGSVEITKHSKEFVEGEFYFRAYNIRNLQESKLITGKFGLVIEN